MAGGASMPSDPMAGGDPNAMGGGMDPMAGSDPMIGGQDPMAGGDPNAMGGGMDPIAGSDPNAMGGQDPMAGGDPMMGSQNNGFEMGIGMTPEENPKKYIEGAVAKIASELRKYQESQPSPDMPLNKTAVNTIAAATKTNLQDGQENELMTSYADTMRGDGDNNEGDNDFDMEQNSDENNMNQDPNAMGGQDTMDGGMNPIAGGDMNNMNIQETIQRIVKEMYKDRLGDIENKPSDNMKPLNNKQSFMRKPFTPPVKK